MKKQFSALLIVLVILSFLTENAMGEVSQNELSRQTSQSMLEIHRIFSESWRLLIGNGSETPNSAMKVLAAKILSPKNDEVSTYKIQADGSRQIKIVKKYGRADTEAHIATWIWNKNLNEFQFTASPSQLSEGFGESLSMLNSTVKCQVSLSENKKISKLSCENLGYGLSRTTHVLFSKFEFNTQLDNVLAVEADRYENLFHKIGCNSKEACLKMQVPVLGQIKIVENRKEASEKKTVEVNLETNLENKKDAIANDKGSEANNDLENTEEENSELAAAGYKPEDFQESGSAERRINPVLLSEGQHSELRR